MPFGNAVHVEYVLWLKWRQLRQLWFGWPVTGWWIGGKVRFLVGIGLNHHDALGIENDDLTTAHARAMGIVDNF